MRIKPILSPLLRVCFFICIACAAKAQNTPVTSDTLPKRETTEQRNPIPATYSVNQTNFIREYTPTYAETDPATVASTTNVQKVKITTQYFDGLGRPIQTVQQKIAIGGYDIVTPVLYDSFGRQAYSYLPYIDTATDGDFRRSPFKQQDSFYLSYVNAKNEKFYYGKTDYEASPLNRVTKTYAPGNSWVGDAVGVSQEYDVNTISDSVRIWNMPSFDSSTLPTSSGLYDAGQLFKTVSTDEAGHSTVEFKDKEGHVILKKVEVSGHTGGGAYGGWLSTYYIYDDMDHLRYVLQPMAVKQVRANGWAFETANWNTSAIAKGYCFSYEYDSRGRMIVKRVPDAGTVCLVYDARDRLCMTQDQNLKSLNKWLFTSYDSLNRVSITGLYTTATNNTRTYQQNLAGGSISYPNPTAGEILTQTYYDDTSWVGPSGSGLKGQFTSKFNNNTTYFEAPDITTYPYPQRLTADYHTKGMVTGTKKEVLGTTTYLYSVNSYDQYGRVIQTISTNYSAATAVRDTTTIQYGFAGMVLHTLFAHKKGGSSPQTYRVSTNNSYDNAGRLTKVTKIIGNQFNAGKAVTMSTMKYDALQNLIEKDLGQTVSSNHTQYTYTNNPVDILNYSYNIRGWLTGINKNYARNVSGASNWFGMELCYDYGFTTNLVNGNIAGEKWRSQGDGIQRAYGFTYDSSNRFEIGDFRQWNGSSWSKTKTDFSVSNIRYDDNGNLQSMKQMGMNAGSIITLDQLAYGYLSNSNQLHHVTDTSNNSNSTLGDFKEPTTGTGQDYLYDGNGNLTKDNNKSIASITYNYLNLPSVITVNNTNGTLKGTITYTYDASGDKLKKVVVDNTVSPARTTTTTYIGLNTYQNDTLQYIATEEGRARLASPGAVDTVYYDYFEKDHLGNTRVVLTDQKTVDTYPVADVESQDSSAVAVEKLYYDIQDNNVADVTNDSNFNNATNSTYYNNNGLPPYNNNPNAFPNDRSLRLYKLNGVTGAKSGLGITLKVMSGDTVDIFGKSYWHSSGGSVSNNNPISAALSSFLDVMLGSSAVGQGVHTGGITGSTLSANPDIATPLTSWLNTSVPDPGSSIPKAYINWILFDEQFNPVSSGSGFDMVSSAANYIKTHHNTVGITQNGYLYIYCSNESNLNVYFDNMQVVQTHGPLAEETHYYPFGLTMAGISSKALSFGDPANKKKYNGIEYDSSLGVDEYEAQLRDLDPQIGRWWQVDPQTENMEMWSPYASDYDNAIKYDDPLGNEPDCCDGVWDEIKMDARTTWQSFSEGAVAVANTFNEYVNPITPITELVTGKSFESGYTQDKPRMTSTVEAMAGLLPATRTEETVIKATDQVVVQAADKEVVQTAANTTEEQTTKAVGPITGHTDHGLLQSVGRDGGRGVNAASKLDAVKNPVKTVEQSGGRMKYVGKSATVVLNQDGKVITTFGKSRNPQSLLTMGNGSNAFKRAQSLGLIYDPKKIR